MILLAFRLSAEKDFIQLPNIGPRQRTRGLASDARPKFVCIAQRMCQRDHRFVKAQPCFDGVVTFWLPAQDDPVYRSYVGMIGLVLDAQTDLIRMAQRPRQ